MKLEVPLFYKKRSQGNPQIHADAVAYALFKIEGIQDVFFDDFITVGKDDTVKWEDIKIDVIETIRYSNSKRSLVIEETKLLVSPTNDDAGTDKITKKIVHFR